jgi:hypothetical protein
MRTQCLFYLGMPRHMYPIQEPGDLIHPHAVPDEASENASTATLRDEAIWVGSIAALHATI